MKRMILVMLVVILLLTGCSSAGMKQRIIFSTGESVLCDQVIDAAGYAICVSGFRVNMYPASAIERIVWVSMER